MQQLATHLSAQGPEVRPFQSTSKTLWAVSNPPGPVTAAREHPCPSHFCLGFFFLVQVPVLAIPPALQLLQQSLVPALHAGDTSPAAKEHEAFQGH